jgi:transcriptional regulator with PAS, ATPase and Fis domain
MHELLMVATRIAHADVPVLVTGPNGVGKEKVAEIVQANSAVRSGPFVKVNVGALPAELFESELFGTEAGAYTGATQARAGRFEAADGGTLFLDEIGNLPPNGQAKLLRVLQTGEFERLGSTRTRRVHVRVISATNSDLPAAIRHGTFREDLYYRLNVITLDVPSLSSRPDDILPLAEHFLGPDHVLAEDARAALVAHAWPGNVRELRNVLEFAVITAGEGAIMPHQLPQSVRSQSIQFKPSSDDSEGVYFELGRTLQEIEREYIVRTLRVTKDKKKTAELLGISLRTLYNRLAAAPQTRTADAARAE